MSEDVVFGSVAVIVGLGLFALALRARTRGAGPSFGGDQMTPLYIVVCTMAGGAALAAGIIRIV